MYEERSRFLKPGPRMLHKVHHQETAQAVSDTLHFCRQLAMEIVSISEK